jgi:hypothetical protein
VSRKQNENENENENGKEAIASVEEQDQNYGIAAKKYLQNITPRRLTPLTLRAMSVLSKVESSVDKWRYVQRGWRLKNAESVPSAADWLQYPCSNRMHVPQILFAALQR